MNHVEKIIKQTIRIGRQLDFYGKKIAFDIIVIAFFLMVSVMYSPWAIQANIAFLLIISVLSFRMYALYERYNCSYLFLTKTYKKRNILFLYNMLECVPYLLALWIQLLCCFSGKWYLILTVGIIEFSLATGIGMSATYIPAGLGRFIPILFFGSILILPWEQNQRIHVMSPAVLLYNLENVEYHSVAGIAGICVILYAWILLLGKIPENRNFMRVVFSALIAFGIWIGGLTVHEYQLNSLTAEEEYHNLGQNDNITFLYKGMSEEQAKRLTVYLDGFLYSLKIVDFVFRKKLFLKNILVVYPVDVEHIANIIHQNVSLKWL